MLSAQKKVEFHRLASSLGMTLAISLLGVASAAAEQVTMAFEGQVGFISPVTWTDFEIGDSMQLIYTFDTAVQDIDPSDEIGIYPGAVIGVQFRVGGVVASLASGMAAQIVVIDSPPLTRGIVTGDAYSIEDVYFADLPGTVKPNTYQQSILLLNSAFDGTVFTDDSLPVNAVDLAGFLDGSEGDVAHIRMEFVDTSDDKFNGHVFSGSLVLLAEGAPEEIAGDVIEDLIQDVLNLNLQQGISNALDGKLDAALQLLDDVNGNNDAAALNTLYAFIASVEAQRGKKLTDEQADELIAQANLIIAFLTG